MKNILKTTITLIIVLNIITSCREVIPRKNFSFKNNSSKAIYYGESYSFPDTSLTEVVNLSIKNLAYRVPPGEIESITLGIFHYNTTIQEFIIDADIMENTPWDTIVKYNMVLKRIQFTESEVEQKDWEIIYNGN